MPKEIDSQALGLLQKSLGLAGAGSAQTELLDSEVLQVLDVGVAARRGMTLAGSGGIYRGVLRNVHPGADTQQSHWLAYAAPTGSVQNAYPTPVPDNFDVWILSASVTRPSGSGNVEAALTLFNWRQGFGHENDETPVDDNIPVCVGFWDNVVAVVELIILQRDGNPVVRLGYRIPRSPDDGTVGGTGVRFASTTTAAAQYECQIIFGVFPVGLGQDALI